jgi:hypothetical protein
MSVASVSVPPPPPSRRAFAVVSTLAGTLAGAAIVSAFFLGHHREVAARSVAPVVTVQAAPTAVTLSPAPETEPPMFVVTPPPSPAAPATSHPIKRAHAPRVVLGERDAAVDVVDSQDSGVEASDSIVESTAGFGNRE